MFSFVCVSVLHHIEGELTDAGMLEVPMPSQGGDISWGRILQEPQSPQPLVEASYVDDATFVFFKLVPRAAMLLPACRGLAIVVRWGRPQARHVP